ncbi:hypothetical protein CYY_005579 [Polysphondylium violaceum]|uniref:FNIP repeat-containing protein n=1 Tax=Polysphondylium violaceum TaxID=133409 RepID=A0A8J4UYM0_9MYCE|nr:hypothetical protein CYY_005579 [Polysphondylium violaceum]
MDSNNNNGFLRIWKNKVLRNMIRQHNLLGQKIKITPAYAIKNLNHFKTISCDLLNIILYIDNDNVDDYETLKKKGFIHKGLHIDIAKKHILTNDLIYKTVKRVKFSSKFNSDLPAGFFPNTVERIYFNDMYLCPIKKGVLPAGLLEVRFGDSYNSSLNGILPSKLETLILGQYYRLPLTMPQSLTHLEIGLRFGGRIEPMPPKLRVLKSRSMDGECLSMLGKSTNIHAGNVGFNLQVLDLESARVLCDDYRWLPRGLVKLKLPKGFNSVIHPDEFPDSLVSLSLGQVFNTRIEPGCLPNALQTLKLGHYYGHSLKGVLPMTLTKLHLSLSFDHGNTLWKYKHLKILGIYSINQFPLGHVIPKTIQKLVLDGPIDVAKGQIPANVQVLKIIKPNSIQDGAIPPSVRVLELLAQPMETSAVTIPKGIRKLTFAPMFLRAQDIPDTVQHLTILSKCDYELGSIPVSVKTLILHHNPNNSEYGLISPNVKRLIMVKEGLYSSNFIDPLSLPKDISFDAHFGYYQARLSFPEFKTIKKDGVLMTNKLK